MRAILKVPVSWSYGYQACRIYLNSTCGRTESAHWAIYRWENATEGLVPQYITGEDDLSSDYTCSSVVDALRNNAITEEKVIDMFRKAIGLEHGNVRIRYTAKGLIFEFGYED